MSKNVEDKIPEIQASFIQNFLKSKLGKDALISSNFRKEYSKCLSLFLYYLATIAKHNQGDSKKKLTKQCILKALTDIGFEDFSDQLSEMQIDFKQTIPQATKISVEKDTTDINGDNELENNHNINEQNIDEFNDNLNNQDDILSDASEEIVEEMIQENNNAFDNQDQQQQNNDNMNILDQIIGKQQQQNQFDNNNNIQQYEEMF